MNAVANPNTPAAINRNSHGASGELWAITTSSTIVFSMIGVSAATDWPRIDTPNAMNTLRLCAMRNGSIRRSQPPASGGAGSGVGRSAASKVVLLRQLAQGLQGVEHHRPLIAIGPEDRVELSRHRPFGVAQRGRASARELEAHAAPVTLDLDALDPAPRLQTVEQTGERRPAHGGALR